MLHIFDLDRCIHFGNQELDRKNIARPIKQSLDVQLAREIGQEQTIRRVGDKEILQLERKLIGMRGKLLVLHAHLDHFEQIERCGGIEATHRGLRNTQQEKNVLSLIIRCWLGRFGRSG